MKPNTSYANRDALRRSLAVHINRCQKIGGAAFTAAVAGSTTIRTLRIAVITACPNYKYQDLFRHLSYQLQQAFNVGLFGADTAASNTAIANLETVNTGATNTDLLRLLCTSADAKLTRRYNTGVEVFANY